MANSSIRWFEESFGLKSQSISASAGLSPCSSVFGNSLKSIKPVRQSPWRFCGDKEALNKIWMNSSSAVIFFDGASKGNPGVSSAGGLVFSQDRLSKFNFCWGLGSLSNNQAESYSLFMAIQIAKENGYKTVQIFGDSKLLIKVLNTVDRFNNSALNILL